MFVDLYKKTREIKRQAELLEEKNRELESANLERLRMLIDLGHELAAEREPPGVLQKFCYSAQRIIDAEHAAVGIIDHDGQTLRHFFHTNSNRGPAYEGRLPPLIQKLLLPLKTEGSAIRLNESDELLLTAGSDTDWLRSFLAAPIASTSGTSGWFYFLNKRAADEFSEADERLAATLATHIAVAYENATLYAEAQNHTTELRLEMAVRKQAEEERARLLIREQAARAEAEAANRGKDEFLAILSHELRTPLTAILGWSHLLRAKKLERPDLSRALDTIERNARAQAQLIDDLLDVSRIITGKLEIESAAVELAKIIEAALDSVRLAAEAKNIRFEVVTAPISGIVSGDVNRLQQIFWNLFSNAVKFTPEEGLVTVSITDVDCQVRIAVSDTGIGIERDFIPYIFDRFRQADGSTTRAHGGLGLGLAIVRHLVELHHGTVEVESEGKDRGATFTVTLPLATDVVLTSDNGQSLLYEHHDFVDSAVSQLLRGVKVLVVDDEADSRDLLMTILKRYGSDVRCSESAAEAMRAFREWNPDLLVSDIGMPNEDGYSLIRKLRKLKSERAQKIPAVALTAYATDEDRIQALSAGFQVHVPKPIEPESFVNSVATILAKRSQD